MKAMRDRLDRIVAALGPALNGIGPPMLVRVRGGMADGGPHACIDGVRLDAEPGEAIEAFEARALDAAAEVGASYVVIGGL